MKEVVLITGVNGMLAKALALEFDGEYTLKFLTREVKQENAYRWDINLGYIDPEGLKGVNHIIHLAGSPIAEKRWTPERKREIKKSRVGGAQLMLDELQKNNQKIDSFISASAIGYYGATTTNHIFTEDSPNADDFLGEVCRDWERVAHSFKSNHVANKIDVVRFGIVLDRDRGALKKIAAPIRFGLGSGVGTGKQWVPWIHIADLCGMLKFVMTQNEGGTYNAVAPEHVTNNAFTHEVAAVLKRKVVLPNIPAFFIRLLFGEMAVVLLTGSRVSSTKITERGFGFKYAKLNDALHHIFFKTD
ncbi:MAG: TIGR01777 family oxidoreductase [Flavobacteriales bacterium]|nr:TIGR01777 family oxidoreductase [Flavobacteriales bacterium]